MKAFSNKKTISLSLSLAISLALFAGQYFYAEAEAEASQGGVAIPASAKSFGLAMGYDSSKLSKQAENLSKTFQKDYGLSDKVKLSKKPSPKTTYSANNPNNSFFSLAPIYRSIFSSITSIPKQTASVFSAILFPIGNFVSDLFMGDNISETALSSQVESPSSSSSQRRANSSSSSVIPVKTGIQEVSNSSSSSSPTYNLPPKTLPAQSGYNLAPSVTRREVLDLLKESDNRTTSLIRSILTAPVPTAATDSLSIQQSLNNLSRRISVMQENSIRQLDKPSAIVTRSDSDISTLANVTMTGSTITGSTFSGTTGTFTGTLTGAGATFSGDVTIGSELTVSGTATSTFAGAILATHAPTLPHTFSVWDTDTANSNFLDSAILINPASAVADSNLFAIGVNNNVKFMVDAEGDVFVRNLTATGTVNQANTSISTLTVENTATFGDAVGDSITINSGTITSANPIAWNLANSQTSALNFESGLFNLDTSNSRVGIGTSSPYSMLSVAGQIVGQNFVATSTTATSTFAGGMNVAGTAGLTVLQNGNVGVGTTPTNKLDVYGNIKLGDGSSSGSLTFRDAVGNFGNAYGTFLTQYYNSYLDLWGKVRIKDTGNIGIGTTSPYSKLSVWGAGTGTNRLFELTNNASTTLAAFQENGTGYFLGNIGIGTTSPNWKLSVAGNGSFDDYVRASYFTATSTTATSTFAGGIDLTSSTGMGLNFGSNTLFYQNNQRFLTSSTTVAGNLTIGYQSATNIDASGGLYNTGLGYQALSNATSTSYNTAVGYQALKGSATIPNTGRNTAVGYLSLTSNTTGASNTALGSHSMRKNTTGNYNVAVGQQTLEENTEGYNNTVSGYQALSSNTIGYNNTANGHTSLYSNTEGFSNTANGYRSLYSNTTGSYNTANGIDSLYFNTTGSNNTADGFESLRNNTTGGYNTANGLQSLNKNTTGNDNIANGYASLYFNTTGVRNTTNGSQSLYFNTTGAGNIGLGYYSGYGDSTIVDQRSVIDDYMTFIGYQASRDASIASTTALSNGIAIGKNARVGGSNMLVLGGTGADAVNVGIGTTSAFAKLSIQNTYGSLTPLFDIASSTSAAYATSSVFRVNADGNVGIGTAAPGYKLDVQGIVNINNELYVGADATFYGKSKWMDNQYLYLGSDYDYSMGYNPADDTFRIADGDTLTTTPRIILNSSGNIGIGTTSPYAKLSVVGPVVAEYFHATSTTATSTFAGGMSVAGSSGLTVLQNGNVGVGTAAPSQKLEVSGDIKLSGNIYGTNNYTYVDLGTNITYQTDTGSGSDHIFRRGDSGEVMRISSNVGIGTTSPASKLDVWGGLRSGTSATPWFIVDSSTGFVGAGTTTPNWKLSVAGIGSFDDYVRASYFTATSTTATSTFAGGATFATGGGNVGIGCSNPDHIFEIGGTGTGCNTGAGSYLNAVGDLAFTANSSREWKQNIATYGKIDILSRIKNTPVRTFDWKPEYCPNGNCLDKLGFIAEEFYGVLERGDDKHVNGQDVTMALWLGMQNFINVFDIASAATGTPALVIDALGNWKIGNDGALTVKEVRTEKLCVGSVCVTEEQFRTVFGSSAAATAQAGGEQSASSSSQAGSSQSASFSSSSAESSSSSPPEPTSDVGSGGSSSLAQSSASSQSSSLSSSNSTVGHSSSSSSISSSESSSSSSNSIESTSDGDSSSASSQPSLEATAGQASLSSSSATESSSSSSEPTP